MNIIIDLIKKIRVIRNEYGVSLSKPIELNIIAKTDEIYDSIEESSEYLIKFLNPSPFNLLKDEKEFKDAVSVISDKYKAYIPLSGLVNFDEMVKDLKNKLEQIEKELVRSNSMLSNEKFLSKAPEAKINEEKEKLNKYLETKKHLEDELKKYSL